jgi:hypothetical protein
MVVVMGVVLHGYLFFLEHVEDLFWLDLVEEITDVQSVDCWHCHHVATVCPFGEDGSFYSHGIVLRLHSSTGSCIMSIVYRLQSCLT